MIKVVDIDNRTHSIEDGVTFKVNGGVLSVQNKTGETVALFNTDCWNKVVKSPEEPAADHVTHVHMNTSQVGTISPSGAFQRL